MKNKTYYTQQAAFAVLCWMVFLSFLERPATVKKPIVKESNTVFHPTQDSIPPSISQVQPHATQPNTTDFWPAIFYKY